VENPNAFDDIDRIRLEAELFCYRTVDYLASRIFCGSLTVEEKFVQLAIFLLHLNEAGLHKGGYAKTVMTAINEGKMSKEHGTIFLANELANVHGYNEGMAEITKEIYDVTLSKATQPPFT
jgi:hypothetical protein